MKGGERRGRGDGGCSHDGGARIDIQKRLVQLRSHEINQTMQKNCDAWRAEGKAEKARGRRGPGDLRGQWGGSLHLLEPF